MLLTDTSGAHAGQGLLSFPNAPDSIMPRRAPVWQGLSRPALLKTGLGGIYIGDISLCLFPQFEALATELGGICLSQEEQQTGDSPEKHERHAINQKKMMTIGLVVWVHPWSERRCSINDAGLPTSAPGKAICWAFSLTFVCPLLSAYARTSGTPPPHAC